MQLQFTAGAFARAAVGPAAELRLRANGIFAAGVRRATYTGGFWEIDGSYFTQGHCPTAVCVHAEAGDAASGVDGPLSALRLVDGAVWDADTLLYRLQPDGRWSRPGNAQSWDEIVLRDAASP